MPVGLTFDRQESGDCTSRVVFPDFRVSAALPAWQRTTVRLDPGQAGEFGFACGMNMIHGTLIVDPAAGGAADESADQAAAVTGSAARPEAGPAPVRRTAGEPVRDGQDAEAAERAGEIADLARRVLAGAVLTLPVLYAVMAREVFRAWVPPVLLSVVGNANRLRRYHPAPLPPARQAQAQPRVETPADAETGPATDPECAMTVNPATAAGYRGTGPDTAHFRPAGCAAAYDADPGRSVREKVPYGGMF